MHTDPASTGTSTGTDPAQPAATASLADTGPAAPESAVSRWQRRAALLLLLAAAALYARDLVASRARAHAARDVRRTVLEEPILDLRLVLTPEGRSTPLFLRCPPVLATNLLSAISRAEPARFPKGRQEGREFEIQIVYTNATARALRAVRLQTRPEALYVGLKDPLMRQGEAHPTEWRVARPTLLADGGTAVEPLLKAFEQLEANLPPEAELLEALSNAVQRASAPTPQTEDADAPQALPAP